MAEKDLKAMYRTRTEGSFPEVLELLGRSYTKVEDLRYGTNPHQPAAFYRPAEGSSLVLGAYKMLKTGKSGLSQTNLEDMQHALGMLKFWTEAQGAVFGAGLGIGAGGGSSQLPEPPVIKQLAQAVLENRAIDNFIYYQPPFPRWAYKATAEMGWRYQARQNGLKPRDLDWKFDPKSENP